MKYFLIALMLFSGSLQAEAFPLNLQGYMLWKMFGGTDSVLASDKILAEEFKSNWTCTRSSIEKNFPEYMACGVAEGGDENVARAAAFENAKAEFVRVCENDDTCRGHSITIMPERTDCLKQENGRYKCLRAVAFLLQKEMSDHPIKMNAIDTREEFQAFVVGSSGHPQLAKGMNREEMFAKFGKPLSHNPNSVGGDQYGYRGHMCEVGSASCSVFLDETGKVIGWGGWDMEYTQ